MRALSRSFSSLSVSVLARRCRSPLVSRLAISTVATHRLIPSSTHLTLTSTLYQYLPHRAFAKMTEHKTFDSATIESLVDKSQATFLGRHTNQAQGIAQYAIDFCVKGIGKPDEAVLRRTELFHTDSVFCGLSALALGTNAPTVLRQEALEYTKDGGATVFGSKQTVFPEKAVLANSSAVREWDSNGTVFGYNARLGKSHMAGEFGHNDFYPVVIAAVQQRGLDGATALRAMLATDEIRGRLAEVFSLKTYRIDHVVHGAIASAAVYGALMGATVQQIEYAIGMVVAHYIPFRAIRAGEQLSDSKGASAAISTEVAILAMHRAMRGFVGPADIFRNPEAIFRNFEPTKDGGSPFDLVLSHSGSDFAVMGMHFKLGLYEHQSAGALQGLVDVVRTNPALLEEGAIKKIKVVAYQPAFGIIGDPHKRNPTTRQSADHSMVYILATLLKKAQAAGKSLPSESDAVWQHIMLTPSDYRRDAVMDPTTRKLMDLIEFAHGGKSYDEKYPEGIPTSIVLTDKDGKEYDSGLVMFPTGHARNTTANLEAILNTKFKKLGALAVKDVDAAVSKLSNLAKKSAAELHDLYNFDIQFGGGKRKVDSSENGSSKKAKHDEENEY